LRGHVVSEQLGESEQSRNELALLRESEKNRLLLRNASDGIHILDVEGNVIEASDAFCSMLGYSREEVIGMNVAQWEARFSAAELAVALRKQFERRFRSQFVTRHRRKDGTVFDVEVSGYPLELDGKPVLFNSSRDITERLQAEEALRASEQRLSALNADLERRVAERTVELDAARKEAERLARVRSDFLANMSHEIRTPMNGVLGLANLLRRTGATPRQLEYLDKIETSGRYLLGIINDILDLSKIEAGKLELNVQDFRLDELVRDVAAVVGDRALAKGLEFRVDMAYAPLWLRGDSGRLAQALVNYLGNAVKFTEHGSVVLSCRVLEKRDTSYLLRFEVTDTGIGMSVDERKRIFEPFEQGDSSTRRKYQGSGLGLAITKRIADLMGAEVGVDSEPGKGSSFRFTVRLSKGMARSAAPETPLLESAEVLLMRHFSGARVLLAEDDPVSCEVAQHLLQSAGLRVEVAGNGVDAVKMVAAADFALILTDMQMPEMDGLEATVAIRSLPGRQTTPILAITASAFDEDRRKCLEAGMNDIIVKPFEPTRLFETVLKWLSKRRENAL
jgi:two-component system sensor histidine kinase/response regulator